jgi:hypothetical protein
MHVIKCVIRLKKLHVHKDGSLLGYCAMLSTFKYQSTSTRYSAQYPRGWRLHSLRRENLKSRLIFIHFVLYSLVFTPYCTLFFIIYSMPPFHFLNFYLLCSTSFLFVLISSFPPFIFHFSLLSVDNLYFSFIFISWPSFHSTRFFLSFNAVFIYWVNYFLNPRMSATLTFWCTVEKRRRLKCRAVFPVSKVSFTWW